MKQSITKSWLDQRQNSDEMVTSAQPFDVTEQVTLMEVSVNMFMTVVIIVGVMVLNHQILNARGKLLELPGTQK